MSGDEGLVLVASLMLGALSWFHWYRDARTATWRRSGIRERWLLILPPLLAAFLVFQVLRGLAASDVRDDPLYLFFYEALGVAWIGAGMRVLELFGLGARDDVVERGNRAAAMAIAGAIVGIALCFAGGNLGEGPGWWAVVFCALLSTGTLLLFWTLLDRLTGVADAVTIDRDPAAGVRVAGFFLALGLILGRAVAGDWLDGGAALLDFALKGWPAAVLLALAVALERRLRPSPAAPDRPALTHGAVPALLYLGLSAAAVGMAGPWR
ncbi:MAG TPA: hypothetical protein VGM86_21885 [Thermoanaerobaculia bacterium]|jgi:uncharacterized membrane protein YjfL (UPF0719 family)